MSRITEIAQSMLDSRLWDEDEINELRDLCNDADISADFGKIYDAYEGRDEPSSADDVLKNILDKSRIFETAEEND